MRKLISVFVTVFILSGCSPEIGTDDWCTALKEKPAGEWTMNETKDYAKHCFF